MYSSLSEHRQELYDIFQGDQGLYLTRLVIRTSFSHILHENPTLQL